MCLFLLGYFLTPIPCIALEGPYLGLGWNTYFMREQITSSDNQFELSHSTTSQYDGFLTQSLGDYGLGFHVGFRKIFENNSSKNRITLEGQIFFNEQNISMESDFSSFTQFTRANYNYGFRIAPGYQFERLHAYLIVQVAIQNITTSNSAFDNNGTIHDVGDDGTISGLVFGSNGDDFSTEVVSFLGGFGLEVPLKSNLSLNLEYSPLKHLEYAIRHNSDRESYFVNELVLNQLQIGLRYWLY
ncbi:MAG: hypothetical protein KTR35_12495 [Gammaproteobacteria bacterium]|nr:hypothetical protein [Gammaproteobacteria bacterium]